MQFDWAAVKPNCTLTLPGTFLRERLVWSAVGDQRPRNAGGAIVRTARELAWPDLIWSHFRPPRGLRRACQRPRRLPASTGSVSDASPEYQRLRDEEGRSAADLRVRSWRTTTWWWPRSRSSRGGAARPARRPSCAGSWRTSPTRWPTSSAAGTSRRSVPTRARWPTRPSAFAVLCDRCRGPRPAGRRGVPALHQHPGPWRRPRSCWTPPTVRTWAVASTSGTTPAAPTTRTRSAPSTGERVMCVQMNDGPLEPAIDDYYVDCLQSRVPPGEGEFDCVGFVQLLDEMGVTACRSPSRCARPSVRARCHQRRPGGGRHAGRRGPRPA